MNNKTSNNTERLKQLAKELRESNEIKRFYGNNFTEGSKYCVVSEAELIPTAEAIEEVLAELEQKDKRIKEMEEVDIANRKVIVEQCDYIQNNSIPKQKIKDKIDELIIQGNYKTFYNPNGRTHFLKEEADYKIEVLEEILQESENQ